MESRWLCPCLNIIILHLSVCWSFVFISYWGLKMWICISACIVETRFEVFEFSILLWWGKRLKNSSCQSAVPIEIVEQTHVCAVVSVYFQVFSGRRGMQASEDVSQVPIHTVYCTAQCIDHTLSAERHTSNLLWACVCTKYWWPKCKLINPQKQEHTWTPNLQCTPSNLNIWKQLEKKIFPRASLSHPVVGTRAPRCKRPLSLHICQQERLNRLVCQRRWKGIYQTGGF